MIDVNNYFTCPVCGQTNVTLNDSAKLFTDTIVDTMMCNSCQAEWRTYLKLAEMNFEVLKSSVAEEQ